MRPTTRRYTVRAARRRWPARYRRWTRRNRHDRPAAGAARQSRAGGRGTPAYKARRWRVCEVMTAPAVSVTEHTSYKQVARLLSEHRLSALPVLSRGGRVIGVVSEADMLHKQERHHSAQPGGISWRLHRKAAAKAEARNAGQLMTSPAVTITRRARRVGGPPVQQPSPAAPACRGPGRPAAGHRQPPRPAERVPAPGRGDRRGGARRADRRAAADPAAVRVRVGQGLVNLSGQVAKGRPDSDGHRPDQRDRRRGRGPQRADR